MQFVGRKHKRKDDCWADALSYATKIDYEKIYKSLKIFENEDGGMYPIISHGILLRYDYTMVDIDNTKTVIEFLKTFNTYDNEVVISIDGHIFYVCKDKVYDSYDYAMWLLDQKVDKIWYRQLHNIRIIKADEEWQ